MLAKCDPSAAGPTSAMSTVMLSQGMNAAAGHVDKGTGTLATPERELNASEQIVGLEKKQHLPWDAVQDAGDLRNVHGYASLNFFILVWKEHNDTS